MGDYQDFWPGFGDGAFNYVAPASESVAVDVLRQFGLPYSGQGGGPLQHVDIKHMDARTAINLSLLDELGQHGTYKELSVDANGYLKFHTIGTGQSVSNVYYTIQSQDYVTRKSGVMVTGGKPLPERKVIKPTSILSSNSPFNPIHFADAKYMASNCLRPYFSNYHVIVYDDPHLASSYNDGIDNLYEIIDPFERILGYAYYIDPGDVDEDVTINFNKQASVPILMTAEGSTRILGTLAKIKDPNEPLDCYGGGMIKPSKDGISLILPPSLRFTSNRGIPYDKFIKVSNVFVVAIELEYCRGVPRTREAALSGKSNESNTDLWISINNASKTVVKLEEGNHYAVGYDRGTIFIQFADRSDPRLHPKVGDDTSAYVRNDCNFGKDHTDIRGSILPTDNVRGLWVQQVYAVVDLDTPCIVVQDTKGRAAEIAEQLDYQILPLIVREEPAPVAYNGQLIDLTDGYADHDPTTTQNFEDTQLEQVLSDMDGGAGMTISLSSLQDESSVARLSSQLYDLFTSDRGVTTTYVCGPDCRAELGAAGPGGGIINEITYSYSDSGSYTISVNEGSKLFGGLPNITTGTTMKMVEEVSANGTVISDEGNHVMFKVLVDGVGVRQAMNTSPSVIRVGDRVSVTIHNNPVEG